MVIAVLSVLAFVCVAGLLVSICGWLETRPSAPPGPPPRAPLGAGHLEAVAAMRRAAGRRGHLMASEAMNRRLDDLEQSARRAGGPDHAR